MQGKNTIYYEKIVQFMKLLLGNALKEHSDLEKGVVTGVLQIAEEFGCVIFATF
jgi:hypothetical protein